MVPSFLFRFFAAPAQIADLGVPPQDLEAHADFVDAVVDDLELGALVDDMLRGGDLAAVVQPRTDAELPPRLLGFEAKVRERRAARRFGLRGLWLAAVAAYLAVAIVFVLWFRFGSWARKEIR